MKPRRWSTSVAALCAGALAASCAPMAEENAVDASADTETTQSALTFTVAKPVVVKPVVLAPLPPPPLAPPVCGKTVRIPTPELDGALKALLGGTRIVYDTTGTSEPILGPYYACTYPNADALEIAVAECNKLAGEDRYVCLQQANEDLPQIKECVATTALYHSFIEFGPVAKDQGAEDMVFDSDRIRKVNRAGTFDIDINFVRTTVTSANMDAAFMPDALGRPSAGISLELTSNNPTIKCQGGLPCPDVNLTNMVAFLQLTGIAPTADGTQLAFDAPVVSFSFDKNINNLPDALIDLFKDVDEAIKDRFKKRLEKALKKEGTHAALNKALTALVEHFAKQSIDVFTRVRLENTDLVVDYRPVSGIGCQESIDTLSR